jgi:hypothetical protein
MMHVSDIIMLVILPWLLLNHYSACLYRTSGVIFFIDYCTAIRDT